MILPACILPFAGTSSDIDHLFTKLIETPLSSLDDVPCEELMVIVIDTLDECVVASGRLVCDGRLLGPLVHAQTLGSGRPLEDVQVGHYKQTRGRYNQNAPRIHHHTCRYSLWQQR